MPDNGNNEYLRHATSVSVEISAHLEAMIATGRLAPGDRLPSERELAATFGVARASLREAMRDLEIKRLIERRPGRGTTVLNAPDTVQELYSHLSDAEHQLRDVAELRGTIEPRIAHLAAQRATAKHLIELESVLKNPVAEAKPEESLQLDLEFHMLLAVAADNPLLSAINTLACSWTSSSRVLSHSTRWAREVSYLGHRAILAAVAAGDSDTARGAMTKHLDDVAALTRDGFQDRMEGTR
ncbi:FadR/GntR family transcriptional regulator [Rhodococcus pyridinivorans]